MTKEHLPVAERRRQFIDAAISVISKEGVAKATTRRIAEVAGVPAASLHYCFSTKEDLFQAVYESALGSGFAEIGLDVQPGIGLQKGLGSIMRSFGEWIRRRPDVQISLYELTMWSLRSANSRHLAQRVYRRNIDGCAQLLREVHSDKESGQDFETLARQVIGALDGIILQWISLDDNSLSKMLEVSIKNLQQQIKATERLSS